MHIIYFNTHTELPGGQHRGCWQAPREAASLQREGGTDSGQTREGDGPVPERESPSVVSQWVGESPSKALRSSHSIGEGIYCIHLCAIACGPVASCPGCESACTYMGPVDGFKLHVPVCSRD